MLKPLIAISALVMASLVAAQSAQPMRLRATIEKVEPGSITVKDRSGEVVTLMLAGNLSVTEVYPIDISEIKRINFRIRCRHTINAHGVEG